MMARMTPRLRRLLRPVISHPRFDRLRSFLAPPIVPGSRLTIKRLLNTYFMRRHYGRGDTKRWSYPLRLTVEPTNVCNLNCPGCFTGLGEVGRERSMMPLQLYRALLNDIGDYLFEVELYNWGEPLLNKNISTMAR